MLAVTIVLDVLKRQSKDGLAQVWALVLPLVPANEISVIESDSMSLQVYLNIQIHAQP